MTKYHVTYVLLIYGVIAFIVDSQLLGVYVCGLAIRNVFSRVNLVYSLILGNGRNRRMLYLLGRSRNSFCRHQYSPYNPHRYRNYHEKHNCLTCFGCYVRFFDPSIFHGEEDWFTIVFLFVFVSIHGFTVNGLDRPCTVHQLHDESFK